MAGDFRVVARTRAPPTLLHLGQQGESRQRDVPHGFEHCRKRRECDAIGTVEALTSFGANDHETRLE